MKGIILQDKDTAYGGRKLCAVLVDKRPGGKEAVKPVAGNRNMTINNEKI